MALEDIDSLNEKELNAAGHVEDHKRIVRGLKSVKEILNGRLSSSSLKSYTKPQSFISLKNITSKEWAE